MRSDVRSVTSSTTCGTWSPQESFGSSRARSGGRLRMRRTRICSSRFCVSSEKHGKRTQSDMTTIAALSCSDGASSRTTLRPIRELAPIREGCTMSHPQGEHCCTHGCSMLHDGGEVCFTPNIYINTSLCYLSCLRTCSITRCCTSPFVRNERRNQRPKAPRLSQAVTTSMILRTQCRALQRLRIGCTSLGTSIRLSSHSRSLRAPESILRRLNVRATVSLDRSRRRGGGGRKSRDDDRKTPASSNFHGVKITPIFENPRSPDLRSITSAHPTASDSLIPTERIEQ